MFINDLAHGGYTPFRDNTKNQPINNRNVSYGIRVTGIDDEEQEWASEDIGDVQFAHFWKPEKKQRDVGSWSLATPAITTGDLLVRPIFDDAIEADERYEQAEIEFGVVKIVPVVV